MRQGVFLLLACFSAATFCYADEEVGTRDFFVRQVDPPLVIFYNDQAVLKVNTIGGRVCGFSRAVLKIRLNDAGEVEKIKESDVQELSVLSKQKVTIAMIKKAISAMRFKPMLLENKPAAVTTPRATVVCEDTPP